MVESIADIGTARRHAMRAAGTGTLSETARGRVAVIASELATNLARHANGGQLLVQSITHAGGQMVELLAIDSGPGMADPARCLRDGFSSRATPGNGLGAVKRLADEFDIYSQVNKGTVVFSRVHGPKATAVPTWRWGALSMAAPGETVVGDSWRIASHGDEMRILVADGVGHGPLASEAAEGIAGILDAAPSIGNRMLLEQGNTALRSTRGAAVAVACCTRGSNTITFAGIGNIAGSLLSRDGSSRGLVSHNGTVGGEMRAVQELAYSWSPGDRLVLHSDGINTRWQLGAYHGLGLCHPAVTGAILYRDFLRGRDDATVVVLECPA